MAVEAPAWEVTLLRRPVGVGKARVAGRVVVRAPDAAEARRAAEDALAERVTERRDERWSLGVLRPLTPRAPGTHRYLVTFAVWEACDDRFVRTDVRQLEVWAADGAAARRIAHQEIQRVPGYRPAWRVRTVRRSAAPSRRRAARLT